MGRVILGVVVGFVVTVLVVFGGLSALFLGLGADATFEPGSYKSTITWLVPQCAITFAAAAVGGYVAMAIGRTRGTMIALVALIVVLGGTLTALELSDPNPDFGPRTGDVSNMEAMMKAQQPDWVTLADPAILALGALVGCRTRRSG